MLREKIMEVRVGDRYAVIGEGHIYNKEIIKIEKIDFNDKCYADSLVYFTTIEKIHGTKNQSCRMWWIQDTCLLVSEFIN